MTHPLLQTFPLTNWASLDTKIHNLVLFGPEAEIQVQTYLRSHLIERYWFKTQYIPR